MGIRALTLLFLLTAQVLCGVTEVSARTSGQTVWEVAVLFVGADEDLAYQKDVDGNVLELSRLNPSEYFRLTVYREQSSGGRALHLEADTASKVDWSALLSEKPVATLEWVPGFSREYSGKGILRDLNQLTRLFSQAYKNPDAKRLLLIYGHGLGPKGLKEAKLKILKENLERAIPKNRASEAGLSHKPVDILWLDACFMASIEVAYELRGLTDFFVSSQDEEFTSGSPLYALASLSSGEIWSPGIFSQAMGEAYLQSYSYTRGGEQSPSVITSPATLSVIEVDKLEPLVEMIGEFVRLTGTLDPHSRAQLFAIKETRAMANPDLSDLGLLLRKLRRLNGVSYQAKKAAKEIESFLDLNSKEARSSNLKIRVKSPRANLLLVYGYDWWGRGFEGDSEFEGKIPQRLTPDRFVVGPGGKRWPAVTVKKYLSFYPFTPDADDFRFYFADPETGEMVSEIEIYTRTRDSMSYLAESDENPVRWVGYTQGMGNSADRYKGLSILDPSAGATNLSYIELDFTVKTGWGAF